MTLTAPQRLRAVGTLAVLGSTAVLVTPGAAFAVDNPIPQDNGGIEDIGNLAMWSLVVGFLSPIVISLLQQPRWTDQIRALVAFVFCALVAIPTAYFAGDLQGKDYVAAALLIFTTAIATYKNFWKPTSVSPSIERSTSPKSQRGYNHGGTTGTTGTTSGL